MARRKVIVAVGIIGVLAIAVLLTLFASGKFDPQPLGGPVAIFKGGKPTRGFLGIEFDSAEEGPLTVSAVIDGSGAAESGVQPGDTIVAIGSVTSPNHADVERELSASAPGDEVQLTIGGESGERTAQVKLMSFEELLRLRQPSNVTTDDQGAR